MSYLDEKLLEKQIIHVWLHADDINKEGIKDRIGWIRITLIRNIMKKVEKKEAIPVIAHIREILEEEI